VDDGANMDDRVLSYNGSNDDDDDDDDEAVAAEAESIDT